MPSPMTTWLRLLPLIAALGALIRVTRAEACSQLCPSANVAPRAGTAIPERSRAVSDVL